MSHQTRYRVDTVFRGAVAAPEILEDTTLYSAAKILSLAQAAEEFVLSFGDIYPITSASQIAFDAACREVMVKFIVNPTSSSISKIGENREEYKDMQAVVNWSRFFGGGSGTVGLSTNCFRRV